ncbi:MAG TPA: TetR-like C-terminal domain-containing protein [Actinospica sp.]|jgi:AcrR family transcriptional regulator|nr:TetR-like C-terminal domain-containing protein [Actinospica sp.]
MTAGTTTTAPAGGTTPRRPGRPRSEQVEDAILDAVIALLSQNVNYDLLSMETIAAKAGVGKAAIYRRWANKEALVIATLQRTFHSTPRTAPAGDTVREQLIDLLKQMRSNIIETHEGTAFAVLLQTLASNPQLMHRYQETVIEPRREQYRETLRQGITNGELRPDLDVERATIMLTSTMVFVCKLFPAFEVTEDYCVGLVDDLLRGAASATGIGGTGTEAAP